MIRNQFDCNLSFFNKLLLFHGFLTVNFTYFLWYSLTNSESIWLELDSFVLFENRYQFKFDFTSFESTRNRYISNVLKLMESIENFIRCISSQKELDSCLVRLCRDSIIKVELGASNEPGLLERDLHDFEFPSGFVAPSEYKLIRWGL